MQHEYCMSLDDCKANSKTGVGFNTPVRITPLSNTNGDNCRELNCLADYCEDAYTYPTDDLKTHSCALETDFDVTFCPDGSSAGSTTTTTTTTTETTAPTEAPTSTPVATTAASVATTATPVVTTAAPVATTAAPVATTAAPVADEASVHAYDDTTGDEAATATPTPKKTKYCV